MIDTALLEELKNNHDSVRLYTQRLSMTREGKTRYAARCPFHSDSTPSFKVELIDGVWIYKCYGGACNATGNVIQFVQNFDHIKFPEAVELVKKYLGSSWEAKKEKVEKVFKPVILKDVKPAISFPLADYAKFEKNLADNLPAQTWLQKERGISYETAKRLHFGYKQTITTKNPSLQDVLDKGWIVFPCIENERVVSLKYRSIHRKAFSQQPGMTTSLFNTSAIDVLDTVYLTSGEFDCAALEQAGFRAVSLPSDSITITPEMRDRLMQADKIVLAGDSDDSGVKPMEKLWAEMKERCFYLHWPTTIKDANQLWVEKQDLAVFKTTINTLTTEALSKPMKGVYSLPEAMRSSGRTNIADHPNRLHFPWPSVDKMAILLPGSVMAFFATNTKMGKTCFALNVTLHGALKYSEVILNYQCELSTDEISNLVAAYLLNKSRNSLDKYDYQAASSNLMNSHVHYYVGRDPTLNTVTPVLDLIEAAIQRLGATIVVLDHIHFICRNEANQTEAEANAMQRIKRMAQEYGVKFIVIGQPRKAQQQNRGRAVHITDWKGSEAGCSDADAVFVLHRNYIKDKDPLNPPMDDYERRSEISLLGARSKGDGATYAILQFHGDVATFKEEIAEEAPGDSIFA